MGKGAGPPGPLDPPVHWEGRKQGSHALQQLPEMAAKGGGDFQKVDVILAIECIRDFEKNGNSFYSIKN